MLRSLYSGVSGLKNFQTQLDVIGNNIANVNTTGYKEGRVTFKDMVSQTLKSAVTPSGANPGSSGGTNPVQVGLGSQIGSIDTIDTQGGLQSTGRTLDIAILGDGYFHIKGSTDGLDYYTRAGNFYLNPSSDGTNSTLVTASGDDVLGQDGNPIVIDSGATDLSINPTGQITYTKSDGTSASTAAPIGIAMFQNPEGLAKVGNNLYKVTSNSGVANGISGTLDSIPGSNGAGTLQSGSLEMSNVDLSDQMTQMIVAQRGFQANTKIITTSDQILQELVNLKQ